MGCRRPDLDRGGGFIDCKLSGPTHRNNLVSDLALPLPPPQNAIGRDVGRASLSIVRYHC